ncbi:phage portal protein [Campylobacter ureolyticus]|uniref:phage portal protein n=1 Tax=Campylobacter ureolyticus TaxID=827 RepID=UPI0022B34271|nr:phage portal protein [Campylobacter ureolyticus]MCZ6110880.1 phage portal protein [Campylobacter ureolyticus]MDK8323783.1 phage portal protein [Campylobacter ureolyticus]
MKKSKRSKSIKKRQSINIKLSDVTTLGQIITNSKIVGKKATAISAVYASIAAISDTISTLPLNLYRLNDKKREIAHDHYLQKIIKFRPNDHLTSVSFLEAIIKNMLTYGNAFIYPIKKRDESIVRLEIIPPENITIFSYEKKPFYNYICDGAAIRLEMDELINIPYFSYDGITGLSPISACKNSLETANETDEYSKRFYKNGAFPSGVLEFPVELSDEAYERLKNSWQNAYSGINSYKTAILEAGAKYTPITIPNKDAQFIELKQFQITDIARIFNIPAHKIGDLTHATFSNIEQQELNYAIQTIRPIVTKIESSFNRWLLKDDEKERYYFKFNLNAMLRGDVKSRFESYMLGRNMGVYSVNEIRELEELNPIEGGDIYDKPLNSNLKLDGGKKDE